MPLELCPHAGERFDPGDGELWRGRVAARKLLRQFNTELAYDSMKARKRLLGELLGSMDPQAPPFIEPPRALAYGEGYG